MVQITRFEIDLNEDGFILKCIICVACSPLKKWKKKSNFDWLKHFETDTDFYWITPMTQNGDNAAKIQWICSKSTWKTTKTIDKYTCES